MQSSTRLKRLVQAALGFAVGGLFLWLAFRNHSWSELVQLFTTAQPHWIATACVTYLATMILRTFRWQLLLRRHAPTLGFGVVGETLILGYAVNNLLPARIGELFRADYAKRHMDLTRSTVLGTIFLERVMDGVTIVGFLVLGLTLVGGVVPTAAESTLWKVAAIGATLFGGAVTFALVAGKSGTGTIFNPQHGLGRRLADFSNSIATLKHPQALFAATLSPLVWFGEAAALLCILLALDTPLAPASILVITGAVSLSTLIPTAPGYLGTYQYAFYLALLAVGADGTVGVVAATLVQIFMFGSLTLLAALVYPLGLWSRRGRH